MRKEMKKYIGPLIDDPELIKLFSSLDYTIAISNKEDKEIDVETEIRLIAPLLCLKHTTCCTIPFSEVPYVRCYSSDQLQRNLIKVA